MDNPAYVIVRDSDQVVVGVFAWNEIAPDGHTRYFADWPKEIMSNWLINKVVRNQDGTFTDTGELHPEEGAGLL